MKKTLALVLALAMVFSTITVAFAEEPAAIGADAQVCADLGMLKGATGTVDAAYLATAPTRLQAAIMFLRLKGLEAEAMAFTGAENFADAGSVAWAEGKNILAYLKAHPELGWAGDGTNFAPNGAVTAQQYYKVMLETLGYKQNTAAVVGDFTWENVIAFAAEKGLTKVAAVANFTVNDVAVATVEALKANMKEGGKTLVASLVEAGKVDAAKAETAGLYTSAATTTDAELKAVKAIANDKMEVEFTAEVEKAFAENAANYAVVVKGSTTALEVKAATAESATKVVVETAAQTAGTAYTLKVGSVSMNFTGLAKDSGTPEVDTVKCVDTNTVEVKFTKALDTATATDIANYTVNKSVTVKAAALSSDRKKVTLTTEGVAKDLYKLTVQNVKSTDLVVMKKTTEDFRGTVDSSAPKLDNVVEDDNNVRVFVYFTDDHGVDKASAETIANYSITDENDEALEIVSIVADDSDDSDTIDYDYVEITTAPMVKGEKYEIKINDLVDGSVSANKTTKALTDTFTGKGADTSAPKIDSATFIDDTKLKVVFDEKNRLTESAIDVANYEISEDIAVKSAEFLDPDNKDGLTVILTTSAVEEGERYDLTVNNVADEFGNVIKTNTVEDRIRGAADDVVPPYVESIRSTSSTKVEIVVQNDSSSTNNELDEASAEDPTNYVINGDLGAALKAELASSNVKVTLTTPTQVAGKAYKVTINGVKDINGNEMSGVEVTFYGYNKVDTTAPVVESIDATATNLVTVRFDEEIVAAATAAMEVVTKDDNGNVTATYGLTKIGTLEDDTAVLFQTNDKDHNGTAAGDADLWVLGNNVDYTITSLTGVKDTHNIPYAVPTDAKDQDTFEGTDEVNEGPNVDSVDQIDVNTFRVVFDEPVKIVGGDPSNHNSETADSTKDAFKEITVDNATFSVNLDPEADANDEGYSTIDLTRNNMEEDDVYGFDFTSFITDYAGAPAIDEEDNFDIDKVTVTNGVHNYTPGYVEDLVTLAEAYLTDEDGAEIVDVEATNERTIKITYNEKLSDEGEYVVKDEDGNKVSVTVDGFTAGDDEVILKTGTAMDSDKVYTLTVRVEAEDLAGNTYDYDDEEFNFVGSSVKVTDYIKGVKLVDNRTIIVYATANITNAVYVKQGTNTVVWEAAGNATSQTIELPVALVNGVEYTVSISGMENYVFKGLADDGNLDVDADGVVTFSSYDVTKYVVKVVYDGQNFIVNPALDKFDLTTMYAEVTSTNYTQNAGYTMPAGAKYTVEVYKAASGQTFADDAAIGAYRTDIDTNYVNVPVYADDFTVPQP